MARADESQNNSTAESPHRCRKGKKPFTMDTDDLSRETYSAVLITAEKFHHDLTLQFGLLSYDCDNDNEFLNESEALINNWLEQSDLKYVVEDIFFDDPPNTTDFRNVLKSILGNILNVRRIPIENRIFG